MLSTTNEQIYFNHQVRIILVYSMLMRFESYEWNVMSFSLISY